MGPCCANGTLRPFAYASIRDSEVAIRLGMLTLWLGEGQPAIRAFASPSYSYINFLQYYNSFWFCLELQPTIGHVNCTVIPSLTSLLFSGGSLQLFDGRCSQADCPC
jgi:hypothetical protein